MITYTISEDYRNFQSPNKNAKLFGVIALSAFQKIKSLCSECSEEIIGNDLLVTLVEST